MILLFTDFGWADPYVGQMKAVLYQAAPGVPVVDLIHDAPDFNAHAGAHLLAALSATCPASASSVTLAVVDPGVGTIREAVVIQADGRWFVGPDNGLLSVLAARARECRVWDIAWRPLHLSPTFHGRDLFAPVAARLARGDSMAGWLIPREALTVRFEAEDLGRILYLDHYGNAWTGLRALGLADGDALELAGHVLPFRRVFADAAKGECFWYRNSAGLVGIACNRGSAASALGLRVGDLVRPVMNGAPGGVLMH